eukprot:6211843-Pleurochrysis_carterae.AAC.1
MLLPLTQLVISRYPSDIAIEADYLAFDLETRTLPVRPSRAPDSYLQTVVARGFHLQIGTHMHSLPFWTRVACVLAERSRSAPQVLGYSCSRWLPLGAAP